MSSRHNNTLVHWMDGWEVLQMKSCYSVHGETNFGGHGLSEIQIPSRTGLTPNICQTCNMSLP